jgi:hypothetical protein
MARFLWGMLGAAAPEVLRLWKARLRPFTPPRSYWPVSIAYAAVGGLLAVAFAQPGSPGAAVYVGVATPFLIAGMVKHAPHAGDDIIPVSLPPTSVTGPTSPDSPLDVDLLEGFRPPSFLKRLATYTALL